MEFIRRIRAVRLAEKPFFRITFKVMDILSMIALIVLFVLHCIAMTDYADTLASTLLHVQLIVISLLFVFQLRHIRQLGAWLVFLANAIMVPIIARQVPMGEFIEIYVLLILILIMFRQVGLPRGVFLAIHLICALFLTYFLGLAENMLAYPSYYYAFAHTYNENTVGILAVACMMHWGCFFDMLRVKVRYRILGQLLGMILGWYYVLHTDCRSALIAAVLFTVLYFFCFRVIPARLYQIVLSLALAVLVAFPFLYIKWSSMVEHTNRFKMFGSTVFTGREKLWQTALDAVRENPWIGAGLSTTTSMHHVLVELGLRFGVIAVISFCLLLVFKDKRIGKCRTSRLAQISFLACMAIACFESFFTDRYLCIFFLSFLLTAVKGNKRDASQK